MARVPSDSLKACKRPRDKRSLMACQRCRGLKKKCKRQEGRERCKRCQVTGLVCRYYSVSEDPSCQKSKESPMHLKMSPPSSDDARSSNEDFTYENLSPSSRGSSCVFACEAQYLEPSPTTSSPTSAYHPDDFSSSSSSGHQPPGTPATHIPLLSQHSVPADNNPVPSQWQSSGLNTNTHPPPIYTGSQPYILPLVPHSPSDSQPPHILLPRSNSHQHRGGRRDSFDDNLLSPQWPISVPHSLVAASPVGPDFANGFFNLPTSPETSTAQASSFMDVFSGQENRSEDSPLPCHICASVYQCPYHTSWLSQYAGSSGGSASGGDLVTSLN